MRELTEEDKKIFRRLRKAYRRAMLGALKRRATQEELKSVCMRVTQRAIALGWLEQPGRTLPIPDHRGNVTHVNFPPKEA